MEGGDQSEDQVLKYCFIFENDVKFFEFKCLKIISYSNILLGSKLSNMLSGSLDSGA